MIFHYACFILSMLNAQTPNPESRSDHISCRIKAKGEATSSVHNFGCSLNGKMAFQPTPTDVSVIITNASSSRASAEPSFVTERRITPTWTVEQVKGKLETMTGVPPGSQRLLVKVPGRPDQWADEPDRAIGDWGLVKGTEIEVGYSSSFILSFFLRPLQGRAPPKRIKDILVSYTGAAFVVHLQAATAQMFPHQRN